MARKPLSWIVVRLEGSVTPAPGFTFISEENADFRCEELDNRGFRTMREAKRWKPWDYRTRGTSLLGSYVWYLVTLGRKPSELPPEYGECSL
jgi:hypothetical protein